MPRVHTGRQEGAGRVRPVRGRQGAALLQRVLRHRIPATQDGPGGRGRLRRRRHGKLGPGHLPRDVPARRRQQHVDRAPPVGGSRCRPRAGSPVVR